MSDQKSQIQAIEFAWRGGKVADSAKLDKRQRRWGEDKIILRYAAISATSKAAAIGSVVFTADRNEGRAARLATPKIVWIGELKR